MGPGGVVCGVWSGGCGVRCVEWGVWGVQCNVCSRVERFEEEERGKGVVNKITISREGNIIRNNYFYRSRQASRDSSGRRAI